MYRHILVPVALDHETMIEQKLTTARHLLSEGGKITLLTVLENVPGFVSEFVEMRPENHLHAKVQERLESLRGDGDNIETLVDNGKPGVVLVNFAASEGVDLIVMGSHKPGLQDYFLGSTAARVARRAPCSVMILRPEAAAE